MCVFCDILRGAQPAHFVHRDASVAAFLDVRPLFPGHVLVVPVEHHETLADLPAPEVESYFLRVQAISEAVRSAMNAMGTFVAMNNVVSQSVPHLHTHVVPRNRKDGLRGFFWPRKKYRSESEMATVARSIEEALARG